MHETPSLLPPLQGHPSVLKIESEAFSVETRV